MNKQLLKKELQQCYSDQAEHFANTRKKQRPEMEYITTYLKNIEQDTAPVIVELWCWWGRTYAYLQEVYGGEMTYIWTDFAPGMIEEAQKTYWWKISPNIPNFSRPWIFWMVNDMINILRSLPDNSVDCIISIASIQHITSGEKRNILWMHMYRVLKYNWLTISVNRSYSEWFLKKYRKQQLKSIVQCILPPRTRAWNDILIPRKDPHRQMNKQTRRRYYHIFTRYELMQWALLSWFVTKQCGYISQTWVYNEDDRRSSRNTIYIWKKSITV